MHLSVCNTSTFILFDLYFSYKQNVLPDSHKKTLPYGTYNIGTQ